MSLKDKALTIWLKQTRTDLDNLLGEEIYQVSDNTEVEDALDALLCDLLDIASPQQFEAIYGPPKRSEEQWRATQNRLPEVLTIKKGGIVHKLLEYLDTQDSKLFSAKLATILGIKGVSPETNLLGQVRRYPDLFEKVERGVYKRTDCPYQVKE